MPDSFPFRVYDRDDDLLIVERKLPHWTQTGTLAFITFRTWDSMPAVVLRQWFAEKDQWLHEQGIDRDTANWRAQFERLPLTLQNDYHRQFSDRWHGQLDDCHGHCVLKENEYAQLVVDSLKHFAGDRYELTDFVVMPNHVHLLAAFPDARAMLKQCESWKHFTATQLNRRLGRSGRFWQQDGFDHLVRSVEQFEYLRQYIAQNPTKANLRAGEYLHESKPLKPEHAFRNQK
jgi:REP element-mobilizing transposase RayT